MSNVASFEHYNLHIKTYMQVTEVVTTGVTTAVKQLNTIESLAVI